MKIVSTKFMEYEISDNCGDCIACENSCESGNELIAQSWTPEEVEGVCNLLRPSPYLRKLKNLGEMR